MTQTTQELGDTVRASLADLIDRQLCPLGLAAIDALRPSQGGTVLDVGCGAGQTVVQLLERVGPAGRVIGVDIGPGVLAVASARTAHLPQVSLLRTDAARLTLPDGSLDAIFSRFGVMFFGDPVAAFGNMRRMLKPGGRLAFVCWRSMRDNELDALPLDAAGLEVEIDSTPYSFDRSDYIANILSASGLCDIAITASDSIVSCGDIQATVSVVTQVGALGKLLRERPALAAMAEARVRAALAARETDGEVGLGAAAWIVTAVAR